MGIEEKDKMEENTKQEQEYGKNQEQSRMQEEGVKQEQNEKQENNKTRRKQKKPKKANHGVQKILCCLQHIALAVMVIALFMVVGSSTVRIEGFKEVLDFNLYSQDRYSNYEDSEIFNTIFGYALSDIVRQGVVSSQLETDGRYDSGKIIDVTAFRYRESGLPERYVTAEYYLGDLLKWANYGFEWSTMQMTQSQAQDFLAQKTRVTTLDQNSQYFNTSNANYLKSDIDSYTFVSDVSANSLWVDPNDYDGFVEGYPAENAGANSTDGLELVEEGPVDQETGYGDEAALSSYSVLVNRYKTVENKNLEEYVSDWGLYSDLCKNVKSAAEGLAYNYDEYLLCREYYDPSRSNVRYIITKTVGDNTQIYTNLVNEKGEYYPDAVKMAETAESIISGGVPKPLSEDGGDRYIYYSPADMLYQTNTSITEDTVRQIFRSYDYAYPETIKLWISVDSSYIADDGFRQGMLGYNDFRPFLWQGAAVVVAAGILYLVIFFYLTCVTGKDVDDEGKAYIRLNSFDKIPTEIAFLLAVGTVVLAAWISIVMIEITRLSTVRSILSWAKAVVNGQWFVVALAVYVFAADLFAMVFFYSLVRRIRAKTLWSNSLLNDIIKRVTRFAWKVYDNSDIVLRTWVPYAAFLLVNILLFAFIFGSGRKGLGLLLMLIFAAAIDITMGILIFRNAKEQRNIVKGIETIAGGQLDHQVATENLHGNNLTLANSVNNIGKGIKEAVEISMKDERMKADLITNVSHDIKTPITSIINYVDLIKREQLDNEKVRNYIKVLDDKSQRLKQLTDDLVEASKISSGNINLNFEKINLTELMNQTIGEFSEKFELKKLTTVMNINAQNAVIEADSRRIWRVIENLFNNIYKYALEGTRVYLTVDSLHDKVGYIALTIKNISATPLNCNPDELTERFIRGDESRTTEGSGLGLSIAKNLTEAQNGTFEIQLDGDLFKVILTFPLSEA